MAAFITHLFISFKNIVLFFALDFMLKEKRPIQLNHLVFGINLTDPYKKQVIDQIKMLRLFDFSPWDAYRHESRYLMFEF
jgi:hypothetical protein